MSIIQSLKKLVDPIRARDEEAEHRDRIILPSQQESGKKTCYECRVCGLVDEKGDYCPECLAQTMEPCG